MHYDPWGNTSSTTSSNSSWDPTHSGSKLSTEARRRICIEISEHNKQPPCGIFLHQDEQDMSKFHAIIMGPENTPYQGGFFYFYLGIPENYPWSPPKVKLMTTGDGQVRFNPNL
jgi:ubiquitin-conjugating enzyme E2 Z